MLKFQRYKSNTASPLIYYLAILPSWLMFGQWIHFFELDTLGIVYAKFVLIWTSIVSEENCLAKDYRNVRQIVGN